MGRRSRKPGGSKASDSRSSERMPSAICCVSVPRCGACGELKRRRALLGHGGEIALEPAAPPPWQGRGWLMGRKHARRLATARPASVRSGCFTEAADGGAAKVFPGLFGAAVWESWACGSSGVGAASPATPRPSLRRRRGTTQLQRRPMRPCGLWHGAKGGLGCPLQNAGGLARRAEGIPKSQRG